MKRKEGEREQGNGETERESVCVCVCECWSKPTTALVNIHNSIRERNTSVAINDCRHLWSISEEVWEFALMRFLTVGLLFSSDIWIDDSSTKDIASSQQIVSQLKTTMPGNFDASELLKKAWAITKPFQSAHWLFSSPAAMIGIAFLFALLSFALWKKCCTKSPNLPALLVPSAPPVMNSNVTSLQPVVIGSRPNAMHFQKSAAPKSITIINSWRRRNPQENQRLFFSIFHFSFAFIFHVISTFTIHYFSRSYSMIFIQVHLPILTYLTWPSAFVLTCLMHTSPNKRRDITLWYYSTFD